MAIKCHFLHGIFGALPVRDPAYVKPAWLSWHDATVIQWARPSRGLSLRPSAHHSSTLWNVAGCTNQEDPHHCQKLGMRAAGKNSSSLRASSCRRLLIHVGTEPAAWTTTSQDVQDEPGIAEGVGSSSVKSVVLCLGGRDAAEMELGAHALLHDNFVGRISGGPSFWWTDYKSAYEVIAGRILICAAANSEIN